MGQIANIIASDPVFRATGEPTGFVDRVATLSFNDANYTFTITGNHDIYIDGVLYHKTTDSIQITDVTGLHWIYYDSAGTMQVAYGTAPSFDNVLIATVYWNTSIAPAPGKGVLADERHGIVMDWHTHTYLHYTVGVRYESGFGATFLSGSFSIDRGIISDEDLAIDTGAAKTTCLVFYKNGSANFEFDGPQVTYYKLNGATLRYNNGNALADVPAGSYVAYWIFATNDVTTPIISLMGQSVETNINAARTNFKYESLTLGTLPYQEMKLIYRVIMRNLGGVATYIEMQDLRVISNLPAGTYVATSHNALTGLEWSVSGHNDTNFAVNPSGGSNVSVGTLSPAATDKFTIIQTNAVANSCGLNISNTAASVAGTVYGLYSSVSGATSGSQVNVGGYFSATNGTTNYSIYSTAGTVYIANSNNATGIEFGSLGTATVGIDFSGSGLTGTDSLIYLNADCYWTAGGAIRTSSNIIQTTGLYYQKDGSYYGVLDFTSSTALGANRTLTIDLYNADRTIAWDADSAFYTTGHKDLATITNIADHSYYGDSLATQTVDTNAYGLFAALYIAADGHYDTAIATASTTAPAVALALETGTGSKKVLLRGTVRDDSWSWTTGPGAASLIYLDPSTAGAMTQTKPTTSGHQIQILGWAITSKIMYFDPNLMLVEIP